MCTDVSYHINYIRKKKLSEPVKDQLNGWVTAQGNIIQQLKLILYRNYLRIKLTKYVQEAYTATYKISSAGIN